MNSQIKKIILENEKILLENFDEYKQSINQYMKKLESINYDAMLYELIIRSFSSKEKALQENSYNMRGFKSSRQLINEYKNLLDFNDRPNIDSLIEDGEYSPLEICSLADNYNNQVGMYYLTGKNCVIIKATVEDNNRTYDNKWLKGDIILRYFMQNESELNVNSLRFSHKPNSAIFNSLMEQELIDIYVFENKKKGTNYRYKGIYHPCGIVSNNKAFLLFKDGHENDIPIENLEAQFLNAILNSNSYPNISHDFKLYVGKKDDFVDNGLKKYNISKRTVIQQLKINLEIALRGEEIVIIYEKNRLKSLGYIDLAKKVSNVSLCNMNLGYDIESFDIDGEGNIIKKYIKVKTSATHKSFEFQLTSNEYEHLLSDENVKLYRVYDIYTDFPKFIDVNADLLATLNKESNSYVFR